MKELYTAAGIFVVLILLGVWMVQNNRNEQEKKLVQLRKKWGKKQGKRTEREKKEKLEACLRRKAGENFCVDAITWNDLDLDAVFDTGPMDNAAGSADQPGGLTSTVTMISGL